MLLICWAAVGRLVGAASREDPVKALTEALTRAEQHIVELNQALYDALEGPARLTHLQRMDESPYVLVRARAARLRGEAIVSLAAAGGIDDTRALAELHLASLLRASGDPAAAVRAAAAAALGQAGDPRGLSSLETLLADPDVQVQSTAAGGIGRIRFPDPQVKQAAGTRLLGLLSGSEPDVVAGACRSLGLMKDKRAVTALAGLLKADTPDPVRREAAQALDGMAEAGVLPALVDALADPQALVRFSVVGALGHVMASAGVGAADRDRVVRGLTEALTRDPDPGVRARVAGVLGEIDGPPVLPALWQALSQERDPRVISKSREALLEVFKREPSLETLREWSGRLKASDWSPLRVEMWSAVLASWQTRTDPAPKGAELIAVKVELVTACIDTGQWKPAVPLVRELIQQDKSERSLPRYVEWVLALARLALKDSQPEEAIRLLTDHAELLSATSEAALAAAWQSLLSEAQAAREELRRRLAETIDAHLEQLASASRPTREAADKYLKDHWGTVTEVLLKRLADGDPAVRTRAVRSLDALLGRSCGFDPNAPEADRARQLEQLRQALKEPPG